MRRIYFLAPDIETTRAIFAELRCEGIEDRHIHILAKRDTPFEDLPEASVLQKTDFIPALERGVILGGTTGLLAGLAGFGLFRICYSRRSRIRRHHGGSNDWFSDGWTGRNEFG